MSEIDHVKCVLGVREKVIENCWHYLYDNFHKLSDSNKIKVALAISTKNIPQKVEGMNQSQVVVMNDIIKNESPVRFKLHEQGN